MSIIAIILSLIAIAGPIGFYYLRKRGEEIIAGKDRAVAQYLSGEIPGTLHRVVELSQSEKPLDIVYDPKKRLVVVNHCNTFNNSPRIAAALSRPLDTDPNVSVALSVADACNLVEALGVAMKEPAVFEVFQCRIGGIGDKLVLTGYDSLRGSAELNLLNALSNPLSLTAADMVRLRDTLQEVLPSTYQVRDSHLRRVSSW